MHSNIFNHEIGHTLGLWHQAKTSGSIISYDSNRSTLKSDRTRLIDAYK